MMISKRRPKASGASMQRVREFGRRKTLPVPPWSDLIFVPVSDKQSSPHEPGLHTISAHGGVMDLRFARVEYCWGAQGRDRAGELGPREARDKARGLFWIRCPAPFFLFSRLPYVPKNVKTHPPLPPPKKHSDSESPSLFLQPQEESTLNPKP